jgi:hypothetical protein
LHILGQSQTKGVRAIEEILSLEETLRSERGILVALSKELAGLVKDDSIGSQSLYREWKEKVEMAQDTISNLEVKIAKKTKALRLEDRASAKKLASLKKDKWINLQLNIRVVRDQLIKKLRARKFELANLERAHASRVMGTPIRSQV